MKHERWMLMRTTSRNPLEEEDRQAATFIHNRNSEQERLKATTEPASTTLT